MTANPFVKAAKHQLKARVAFAGPTGSGKTYTALEWATILAGPDGTIAVVDTEHGSASLYADRFEFDVLAWSPPYDPGKLADTIKQAEHAGYAVLVIDSGSHFYEGEGGTLDIVDAAAQKAHGNSFAGWKVGTPALRHLVDTMLACNMHVIMTMRSKMEYILETNSQGKQVPKKVGMAPVMRAGVEYEFTMVGDIDLEHRITFTKSRCSELADVMVQRGRAAEAAQTFIDWLESGEPAPPPPPPPPPMADDQRISELAKLANDVLGETEKAALKAWRDREGIVVKSGKLTAAEADQVEAMIVELAPQDSTPDGSGVTDALVGDPEHATGEGDGAEGWRPDDAPPPDPEPSDRPDGPPITDAQLRALHAALRDHGKIGPARHEHLTGILGRTITSTKDLTKDEASQAIDQMKRDLAEQGADVPDAAA